MKKCSALVLILVCMLGVIGCSNFNNDNYGVVESTKANLSEIAVGEPLYLETSSGVGVEIAYESADMLIFYGDFGLFGYDLKSNELKFSVDFVKAVGIEGSVQGSYGTVVDVSEDGNTIIISEYNADKSRQR